MKLFVKPRRVAAATMVLATGALLVGCGSQDTAASSDQQTQVDGQAPGDGSSGAPDGGAPEGGGPGGGGGFTMPGTSGLIAAVDGSTMQVQTTSDGQVSVSWTKSTTFTKQVSATLSKVTAGSCVMVVSADSSDSSDSDTVTAASVRILDSCDQMGGGMPGGGSGSGQPSGMPTDMPSDMPTDMPSDMDGGPGRGGFGGGVFGEVTAVSGSGFTVESSFGDSTTTQVSVTADTTYSATAKASSAAVKAGLCATATGDSDDTGAVTAETVALTKATNGECGMGMRS